MRDNEENYKFFVEDDQSFEHHVECMSQDATYGGNMELAAFAKMREVDIKVYQPGMMYNIILSLFFRGLFNNYSLLDISLMARKVQQQKKKRMLQFYILRKSIK